VYTHQLPENGDCTSHTSQSAIDGSIGADIDRQVFARVESDSECDKSAEMMTNRSINHADDDDGVDT